MTRVAHLTPVMGVGGMEQILLQLARLRDRGEFDYTVAAPQDSPIAAEIRREGVPVYTGPNAFREAARGADLVNLHWWRFDAPLLALAQSAGLPVVTALQWQSVLPQIPAVTICSSAYTYRIQPHRERCVLIPNGVDLTPFRSDAVDRRPDTLEPDTVVLTRVCRPPKCALYFWEAMRRVLSRYPQARLRIVGNPDPVPCPGERVEFLGIRRDVPALLAESDVFVYTPYPQVGSKDLAVMEAAAAGLPCVVSDVPATNESVFHGETGFLCPFGDVDDLVDKVSLLIEDVPRRAAMGRAAARVAREQFDGAQVARRYEAVYHTVLEASGGEPWWDDE
jgi:glycosyltransferase involved in cell wall biosynthesis